MRFCACGRPLIRQSCGTPTRLFRCCWAAARRARSPMSQVQSVRLATNVRCFDPDYAHQQLADIIGAEKISASPHLRVSPSPLTVAPGSIAEVCAVMKLASSEGWAVVPSGAMTWLDAG